MPQASKIVPVGYRLYASLILAFTNKMVCLETSLELYKTEIPNFYWGQEPTNPIPMKDPLETQNSTVVLGNRICVSAMGSFCQTMYLLY